MLFDRLSFCKRLMYMTMNGVQNYHGMGIIKHEIKEYTFHRFEIFITTKLKTFSDSEFNCVLTFKYESVYNFAICVFIVEKNNHFLLFPTHILKKIVLFIFNTYNYYVP